MSPLKWAQVSFDNSVDTEGVPSNRTWHTFSDGLTANN